MNGDEVKKNRERLELSQEAFAKKLGVSSRTVQNWEAGGRVPRSKVTLIMSLDKQQDDNELQNSVQTKNERLALAIDYLIKNKYVRNQQELSERIEYDHTTLSAAKNGSLNVPNKLFELITKVFTFISLDWLLTGNGPMIIEQLKKHVSYGGNVETFDKLVDALAKSQSQIDKLLNIIDNLIRR